MDFVFEQTWILFILVSIFNTYLFYNRAKPYIEKDPTLENGYRKITLYSLSLGNIPWLIMGIGNIVGFTHNTFEYLNPNQLKPIVLAFHASIIILWICLIIWIYFMNGAEFLEKHPGLLRHNPTAKHIKFMTPIMLLGSIIAIIMMWNFN